MTSQYFSGSPRTLSMRAVGSARSPAMEMGGRFATLASTYWMKGKISVRLWHRMCKPC